MKTKRCFSPLALLAVTLAMSSVLPDAVADERRRSHTHYYTYDSRGRIVEVVREVNDSERREAQRREAERREAERREAARREAERREADHRDYGRRYEHSGYRQRYDSDENSGGGRSHRGHDYNRQQALRLFEEFLRR